MPAYEEVKLVSEASIFALGLASTVFSLSACSQLFVTRAVGALNFAANDQFTGAELDTHKGHGMLARPLPWLKLPGVQRLWKALGPATSKWLQFWSQNQTVWARLGGARTLTTVHATCRTLLKCTPPYHAHPQSCCCCFALGLTCTCCLCICAGTLPTVRKGGAQLSSSRQ